MNKRVISTKYLSGNTKYCYCPYCVNDAELQGKDYKECVKPLRQITVENTIVLENGSKKGIESYWECMKCSRKITTDTFRNFYTCRYDGTKWNQLPNEPGLVYSPIKKELVPAKWNQIDKKWEEIE